MKKLFIGALIALSTVSFAACANSNKTTGNASEPTQVEEQAPAAEIPMDDAVDTMDDSAFSADLATRANLGSTYCFEISDMCNQVSNDPYSAPNVAYIFDEYADKVEDLIYTEDEMAMMSDEQLEIASTWNDAMNYLETGCSLLADGCETMDEETIAQANYYIELANDTLTK